MPEAATMAGALCASHPDRPATATCSRCGTFLCDTCLYTREPALCASCHAKQRNRLAIDIGPFSIGSALGGGWKLFSGCALPLLAITAVFSIPETFLDHAFTGMASAKSLNNLASRVYGATIGLVATIACVSLMASKAEGTAKTVWQTLGAAESRWGHVFGARFMAGLQILLYSLLLIVPGIVVGVKLSLVTTVAVVEETDAIDRSRQLLLGHAWEIFAMWIVSIVAALIPYVGLVFGANVIAELAPATLPGAEFLASWGANLIAIFLEACGLAAFYSLRLTVDEAEGVL